MQGDEVRKNPAAHEVGMVLDSLSVDELGERIEMLRKEITRIMDEIERKAASRSVAENVFK